MPCAQTWFPPSLTFYPFWNFPSQKHIFEKKKKKKKNDFNFSPARSTFHFFSNFSPARSTFHFLLLTFPQPEERERERRERERESIASDFQAAFFFAFFFGGGGWLGGGGLGRDWVRDHRIPTTFNISAERGTFFPKCPPFC